MATYYVGPQAGTGAGTFGDPYNLAQANNAGLFNDIYLWFPGNYTFSVALSVPRRCSWFAYDPDDRPVLTLDTDLGGAYMVTGVTDANVLDGFVIDSDGNNAAGVSFNFSPVQNCKITCDAGIGLRGYSCNVELIHTGTGSPFVFSTLTSCKITSTSSTAATNNYFAKDCVFDLAFEVQIANVENCVIKSGGSAFHASLITNPIAKDSISYDSVYAAQDDSSAVNIVDCFEYSSTNASPTTYTGLTELTSDIFLDFVNGDLRLTAYGLSIQGVKNIMAQLVGVPGIQTDSLADLVGGGGAGSAAFNPYQSAFYRG